MNALIMVFTACAIVGGTLFVIRLILQFVAGVDHGASDVTDIADSSDVTHTDLSFKLLSLQGITAFLMMFGLAGRALLIDSHVHPMLAILGAALAGAIAVWIIAKLFSIMKKLQSPGEVLDLNKAVGVEGKVYLTIPAGGSGKINLKFHNHFGEFEAVSETGDVLPTDTLVKVVAVRNDRILVVKKV